MNRRHRQHTTADFVRAFYSRDDLVCVLVILRRKMCSAPAYADTLARTIDLRPNLCGGRLTFLHGLRHGLFVMEDPDCVVSFEAHYLSDQLHGRYREWFSNGQLHTEVTYIRGRAHGKNPVYNDDGTLASITTWHHGLHVRRRGLST